MSGYIQEQHLYTAHCPDCPWWGTETTNEAEAEEELSSHERDEHR